MGSLNVRAVDREATEADDVAADAEDEMPWWSLVVVGVVAVRMLLVLLMLLCVGGGSDGENLASRSRWLCEPEDDDTEPTRLRPPEVAPMAIAMADDDPPVPFITDTCGLRLVASIVRLRGRWAEW